MTAEFEPLEEPAAGVSERSRGVALVLAAVGGVFGLHRFYTGRASSGVWMCLTLGGCGIWYLYDVVVVAAGDFSDAEGRRVVRWGVATPAALAGAPGAVERRVEGLEERLRGLESQLTEVGERLDFAERLLAQVRERERLPNR